MPEPVLGPTDLPHFIVKQLNPSKHGLSEADLVTMLQEVETQTQILGASFLKLHMIDEEWKLMYSGLFKVDEDGLLNELVVEFPEHSGYQWQLCAIEFSTEVSQANVIPVFEDIIVAQMRKVWGHRTFPPGLSTRAQVIKALVAEVNLKLKLNPPIRFVCPGLNRVEPVAEAKPAKTSAVTAKQEAEANKERGLHPGAEAKAGGIVMNPGQRLVVGELLKVANELNAGQVATEALIYAAIGETRLGANNTTSSAGAQGVLQSLHAPFDTQSQAKRFLQGGEDFHAGGAIKRSQEISDPKQIAVEVEVPSIWPVNAYEQEQGGQNFLTEAQEIIHAAGGVSIGGTTPPSSRESDVGQLSRGTSTNPDEDSWDCAVRLAQEVSWNLFTDGKNTIYYMDGPDLIAQRPVLYIDGKNAQGEQQPPSNWRIIREDTAGHKIEEYGAIVRPFFGSYDNTAFLYRATHKIKGRLQRKSKISKPQTPSELRLLLLCDLSAYRAGDVVVFRNCGPCSENGGRWIMGDVTREAMKYPYSKIILNPPVEPLPEPKGTTGVTPTGEPGKALTAFNASATLSAMELPYLWGGGHQAKGLEGIAKGGPGLDCSGSVCWVLKQAGMFSSSAAEDSGELASNFGEQGKGKEMTVWANADHVFIEFNIPTHSRAQMNTNGPQNGPRLYTLAETSTYNLTPETEGFTARHFPNT